MKQNKNSKNTVCVNWAIWKARSDGKQTAKMVKLCYSFVIRTQNLSKQKSSTTHVAVRWAFDPLFIRLNVIVSCNEFFFYKYPSSEQIVVYLTQFSQIQLLSDWSLDNNPNNHDFIFKTIKSYLFSMRSDW